MAVVVAEKPRACRRRSRARGIDRRHCTPPLYPGEARSAEELAGDLVALTEASRVVERVDGGRRERVDMRVDVDLDLR